MCGIGVRNGPMVKGWDLWSRDSGSIFSAGRHFWFGCGLPFTLARTLLNGTKINESLHTPRSTSAFSQRVADTNGYRFRGRFEYYSLRCTLERITLSTLNIRQDVWYSKVCRPPCCITIYLCFTKISIFVAVSSLIFVIWTKLNNVVLTQHIYAASRFVSGFTFFN